MLAKAPARSNYLPMEDVVQDELVDAVADETIHLRAELNAVKAELRMMSDALQRIAVAAGLALPPLMSDPLRLPQPSVPAAVIADASSHAGSNTLG